LILGLLLEQMQNRGPTKVGVSTEIRDMGPGFGATAGVALIILLNQITF